VKKDCLHPITLPIPHFPSEKGTDTAPLQLQVYRFPLPKEPCNLTCVCDVSEKSSLSLSYGISKYDEPSAMQYAGINKKVHPMVMMT